MPALDRLSLADRTALVTGASKGIGEAVARGLAEAGARVIGPISALICNRPQNRRCSDVFRAVHQFVHSIAPEWAQIGVRINAIAPGYIETPMTVYGMEDDPEMAAEWLSLTPMNRVGQPIKVATIAVFLASSSSSYMTGSVGVADGGYTLW